MNTPKLHKKATTFLSYQKQESIISKLEIKFYDTILIYGTSHKDREEATLKIKALEQELQYTLTNYYFEDDLLEYLFNIAHFITNYLAHFQEAQQKDIAPILSDTRKSIVSSYH